LPAFFNAALADSPPDKFGSGQTRSVCALIQKTFSAGVIWTTSLAVKDIEYSVSCTKNVHEL
jgi:hypothetical protein